MVDNKLWNPSLRYDSTLIEFNGHFKNVFNKELDDGKFQTIDSSAIYFINLALTYPQECPLILNRLANEGRLPGDREFLINLHEESNTPVQVWFKGLQLTEFEIIAAFLAGYQAAGTCSPESIDMSIDFFTRKLIYEATYEWGKTTEWLYRPRKSLGNKSPITILENHLDPSSDDSQEANAAEFIRYTEWLYKMREKYEAQ